MSYHDNRKTKKNLVTEIKSRLKECRMALPLPATTSASICQRNAI